MWRRGLLLVSFALIALGSTTKCPKRKTSPAREILCYTSTFDVELLADSVCSCTTLVHQNHDVQNLSTSGIAELRQSLREMHPPLQFVISIQDAARTLRTSAMLRQEAVARIIAIAKEVDGVELNVTAGSKERLYNFVKSLRNEMIRKSYDKRIFLVLPTKSEDIAKQFDLKELAKYVDLFTLPTDYLTDEDEAYVTFHPSRLMGLFDMLNTDSLVDLISGLGAPKWKILVSLPANAYRFTLKDEAENAPRSETTEKDPVPIDRKQLCESMSSGEWTVERDEDLTAPYAFRNNTWISFEDKISVGIKGKYALLRDLAGLAVRNIENDTKTECEKPLTHEIYHSFTEFKRKSRQAVLNALEDELHQAQFSYPNQAKTSSFRVVRVVDTEGHIRAMRESTQTEFVCKRQGYFVHPKSCNRFYRCVKFNQAVEDYSVFEFDCPAGLSFDERTEVCVWPGSLPEGSPCPGSSEIAPVAPKRFECPASGYYADPQNCRWFFACMDLGEEKPMAFEFRCPYGLVFDEKKLVCEWPWLVPGCSESGSAYARTEYNYGGYTAGSSTVGGAIGVGGYVTGGLPEYSVTAGSGYSGTDGYSKTIGTSAHGTSGASYYGASHTGASTLHGGTIPGHIGSFGPEDVGYSGSLDIHVGSASPNTIVAGGDSTIFSPSSSAIGSTGFAASTGQAGGAGYSGYAGGVNTGYTNTELLGVAGHTAISEGSTAGGYFGSSGTVGGTHTTGQGVTYSGISGSGYSGSTVEGQGAGNAGFKTTAEGINYSKATGTSYFGSSGTTGSSTGIHVGPTGPKYTGSNVFAGSGTYTAGGQSASTDIYSGAIGRVPSSSEIGSSFGIASRPSYSEATDGIGITGSIHTGYTESTAGVYRGSTDEGYSKGGSGSGPIQFDVNLSTSSGVGSSLQTGSGHISGTNFIGGVSRPELTTSGISVASAHAGSTGHFVGGSTQFAMGSTGGSSTRVRYDHEEGGYTVPVFIQHEEPIYRPIGTTATGIRDYAGTTEAHRVSASGSYGKTDLARPSLNISIFGNEIPTGYGVQTDTTGAILTGGSVEGSILTGDSSSGTVLTHGSTSGVISTASIDQGTILTGGVQPGYISTSIGTPGYVLNEGVKTLDVGSVSPGTILYGAPTPAISLTGPSTPGVVLKGDNTPNIVVSGQTVPGVSIGGSVQPGIIIGSTSRPYVSQSGITYHDNAATRGYSSSTLNRGQASTSSQGYQTDARHGTATFNVAYDTSTYSEKDIPDYRPTSATLPESIVSGGRIDSAGGISFGSTLAGVHSSSSTFAPGFSSIKSSVFTPSGFTKTGPTKTGITTAILGGGGSYSVSTSERRPILYPENIGEKAFEGNVGYTKTSSISNTGFSTLAPPGYSATAAPDSRVTLPSGTSGYSYPKPTVQFETNGPTFTSVPILPTAGVPVTTTPAPFLNVEVYNGSPDRGGIFGSKIPTVPTDRNQHLPTSTMAPIIYTTPQTYKTTLFEAAKVPVSTVRPVIDTGYKTVISSTSVPMSVFTDDRFTQQIGVSHTASISSSSVDLGIPFQRTDSGDRKDYSSFTSPILEYLPGKPSQSGTISTTSRYDVSTVRPELGVIYKKPISGITYQGPSSTISPTTYKPSEYYSIGQSFSTASSLGATISSGSPTNLGISRDKIDKLITNYDTMRGTVKYTPSTYDTFTSSGYDSTLSRKFSSSLLPTKLASAKTGGTFATSSSAAYEVTTKSYEGKGKVIVKWSDLHPLLLGKLGAECTCKADPFATLRGPGKKNLIASSKGKVDLANYDESDIYVDLERDGSSEEGDYTTDYDNSSPQPFKISGPLKETGITNLLSSTYLPVPSTTVSARDFLPSIRAQVSANNNNALDSSSRFRAGLRIGKKLKDTGPSPNSIASFDEEDDPDQIINGVNDCARPGLFRHPSLCNKFYACHWDQWKKKFTLHIFNCPVHLTFDSSAGACNWPSKGPACQADNLLV